MMERPSKRPRLAFPEDPGQLPDDFDVQEARAQNDLRLKSLFEGIFEKYGKDFSDVGDEIDLQTGEIVLNNGHLSGMRGEVDIGEKAGLLFQADEPPSPEWSSRDFTQDDPTQDSDRPVNRNVDDLPESDGTNSATGPKVNLERMQLASRDACENADTEVQDSQSDDGASVDPLVEAANSLRNSRNGNMNRHTSHGKAAAQTAVTTLPEGRANSSFDDKGNEARSVESLWRVPDIEGKFSTPTVNKMPPRPSPLPNGTRSASPPGAGSLWAIPTPGRRRNTDVQKKTKKQVRTGRPKHRQTSAPMKRDWSFAINADESESDDPLQEDYQPSPTPKPSYVMQSYHAVSGVRSSMNTRCSFCKESFSAIDLIKHLNDLISRNSFDGLHDLDEVKEQRQALDTNNSMESKLREPGLGTSIFEISRPQSKTIKSSSKGPINTQSPTPEINKRTRTPITPDEARFIVRMRQINQSAWKEISAALPGRTHLQITQWNHSHWYERLANPPKLSKPWSDEDREKLVRFKDESGMSWRSIQAEFPGRSRAEIEFELLRLWVGDSDWEKGDGRYQVGEYSIEKPTADEEKTRDTSDASQSADAVGQEQEKPSLTCIQNGPSTPQKQALGSARSLGAQSESKDFIEMDPFAEDSDGLQTASGLSSIQLEARQNGGSTARYKRSPSKNLLSPLTKRSGL